MNATHSHTRHVHEAPPMHDAPDAWHDHSHDPDKPQQGHAEVANAGRIIATGMALFMVIVVAVVVVYGFYTDYTTKQLAERERASSVGPATDALKFRNDSLLVQTKGGAVESLDADGKRFNVQHTSFDAAREMVRREYLRSN